MSNFVASTVASLGNLTETIDAQGLNVGVVSFSTVSYSYLLPATGDVTKINDTLTKLTAVNVNGQTYLAPALERILQAVKTSSPLRPKALLMITDGLFQDANRVFPLADQLRQSGVAVFGVAISSSQATAQREQLLGLTGGDAGRVFAVSSALSLNRIVGVVSSLSFDDFKAVVSPQTLNSAPFRCVSAKQEEMDIVLTGPSVQQYTSAPGMEKFVKCVFSSAVTVNATLFNGVELRCAIPPSAFSAVFDSKTGLFVRKTTVGLILVDDFTFEQRALRHVESIELVLDNTVACNAAMLGAQTTGTRCAGDVLSLTFPVAMFPNQIDVARCVAKFGYRNATNYATRVQDVLFLEFPAIRSIVNSRSVMKCETADPSSMAIGSVDFISLDYIGSVSILNIPLPRNEVCVGIKQVNSTYCFGADLALRFIGQAALSLTTPSPKAPRCIFRDDSMNGQLVELAAGLTQVVCVLNSNLVGRNGVLFLAAAVTTATPLSALPIIFAVAIDSNAWSTSPGDCVSTKLIFKADVCLLETGRTLVWHGIGITALLIKFQFADLQCQFIDDRNKFIAYEPMQRLNNDVQCGFPKSTTRDALFATFDRVRIFVGNVDTAYEWMEDVQDVPRASTCIQTQSMQNAVPIADFMGLCWGTSNTNVVYFGKAIEELVSIAGVLTVCRFSMVGISTDVPITYASNSQAQCVLPLSFLDLAVGTTASMTVRLVVKSTQFERVIAVDAFAFSLKSCLTAMRSTSSQVCWGTPVQITLDSSSLFDRVAQTGYRTTCMFVVDEIFTIEIPSDGQKCIAPQEVMMHANAGSDFVVLVGLNVYVSGLPIQVVSQQSVLIAIADNCYTVSSNFGRPPCTDFANPSEETGDDMLVVSDASLPIVLNSDLRCEFDGQAYGLVVASPTSWMCAIPKRPDVALFAIRGKSGYALAQRNVRALTQPKPCIDANEQSSNNCVGSVYTMAFTGKTILSAIASESFLVCEFAHSVTGVSERVPVEWQSPFKAVCSTSAFSQWQAADVLRFDSVQLRTGFTHIELMQKTLSLPRNEPCATIQRVATSACVTSHFAVELTGQGIDFFAASTEFNADDVAACLFLDANKNPLPATTTVSNMAIPNKFSCASDSRDVAILAKYVSFKTWNDAKFALPESTTKMCISTLDTSMITRLACNASSLNGQSFDVVLTGESVDYFAQAKDLALTFRSSQSLTSQSFPGVVRDPKSMVFVIPMGFLSTKPLLNVGQTIDVVVKAGDRVLVANVANFPVCVSALSANVGASNASSDSAITAAVVVSMLLFIVLLALYVLVTPRHSLWCKNKIATLPNFVLGEHGDVEKLEASIKKHALWRQEQDEKERVAQEEAAKKQQPTSAFSSDTAILPTSSDIQETMDCDVTCGQDHARFVLPTWMEGWTMNRLFGLRLNRVDDNIAIDVRNNSFNPDQKSAAIIAATVSNVETTVTLMDNATLVCIEFSPCAGLGLSLGRTADGRFVIESFSSLPKSPQGPVEASGAAWVHDQVMEIDGITLRGITSMSKLAEVIRQAMKKDRMSMKIQSQVDKKVLGYGAYQVIVPRGCRMGLEFERSDNLTVAEVFECGPLRNLVSIGSKLTAVDGHPVHFEREFDARTSLDKFEVQTIRLRFVAPRRPVVVGLTPTKSAIKLQQQQKHLAIAPVRFQDVNLDDDDLL